MECEEWMEWEDRTRVEWAMWNRGSVRGMLLRDEEWGGRGIYVRWCWFGEGGVLLEGTMVLVGKDNGGVWTEIGL